MEKGQKYVVQCHTKFQCHTKSPDGFLGLGAAPYDKGDYVAETFGPKPTRKLSEAAVYTHGDQWEDFFSGGDGDTLAAYFKAREVKVIHVVQLDEPKKVPSKPMTDFKALRKKAYHPSKLTDRELAQLRRSSSMGSNLSAKVLGEMKRRGLVQGQYNIEVTKKIDDYPIDRKSLRIN